jgi:hypothetical protein
MIKLPNFKKSFEYENNFYLTCDSPRIGKFLAHYELYNTAKNYTGEIVECGVFKGASLSRFAMFRELFENQNTRKIIGFDIFGKFPKTGFKADMKRREQFIVDAGKEGISKEQLINVLKKKKIYNNIELVQGDVTKTVPKYLEKYPELRISLLNLDTDIYEPAVTILECLYPRIVKGGILVLDDYGVFPGETEAVDEYFKKKNVKIQKFPFSKTPSYIIKK